SMAALTWGPSTSDAPHQHMAQAGSSSVAFRKARSAASWLNPQVRARPWSNQRCTSGTALVTGKLWFPRPSRRTAPIAAASGGDAAGAASLAGARAQPPARARAVAQDRKARRREAAIWMLRVLGGIPGQRRAGRRSDRPPRVHMV